MYLQRDVPLFVLFMSCQSISITYRRAVAAGWPEGHNLAPLDEASATMSCWASTASLALGMTLVRMFAQWGSHLESELENKIYSYRVSQKRDLQNFDNSSLNKVEPYAQTTIFQYQKNSLNVVDTKDPKNLFFFGISCSSLFMVLTIALVPIIVRTHTNISFVILFSLLTPTPFSQGFLCHHTGACQSSSYGLSTSNTHGRAIPRNHGFLEVAFAYMVGESLLQIEIFQVGRSTFGETPLSLTAHWKHLWPGGKILMMKKWWSLIPLICHGSHGYIRVNFFGRCKFLQI